MRAIPRAHPAGLFVRCRRKAMGPREEQSARVLRAEAKSERQKRSSFCSAALDPRPRQPRRGQAGIARQGRAQGCARVREWAGCPSSEPRPDLAHPEREARRARLPGCISFGYFSLCKQRKVTRSHGCERKNEGTRPQKDQEQRHWIPAFAGMTGKSKGWIPAFAGMTSERTKTLDSGFRRNDEQKRQSPPRRTTSDFPPPTKVGIVSPLNLTSRRRIQTDK